MYPETWPNLEMRPTRRAAIRICYATYALNKRNNCIPPTYTLILDAPWQHAVPTAPYTHTLSNKVYIRIACYHGSRVYASVDYSKLKRPYCSADNLKAAVTLTGRPSAVACVLFVALSLSHGHQYPCRRPNGHLGLSQMQGSRHSLSTRSEQTEHDQQILLLSQTSFGKTDTCV